MTIPDDVYRRTEGILYRHFRSCRLLYKLEAEIEELEAQIAYLEREVERGLTLVPRTGGVRYFEGVNESPGSPIEGIAERAEEHLEKLVARLSYLRAKCLEKKLQVQRLRERIVPVKAVLDSLSEEDRMIIEKRYDEPRWSYSDIADLIKSGRSSVHRRVRELTAYIAGALEVGSDTAIDESPDIAHASVSAERGTHLG